MMHVVDVRYASEIVQEDVPYHQGKRQARYRVFYCEGARRDPIPCDDEGRTIKLGDHLHKIVKGSALLPVAADIAGEDLLELPKDAYYTYEGPSQVPDPRGKGAEERFALRVRAGKNKTLHHLTREAFSEAFTLAASHYISFIESRRPTGAPKATWFDEVEQEWTFGEEHPLKAGRFQFWNRDGTPKAERHYKAGVLHGPFSQHYPDGTLACAGAYAQGVLHGAVIYQRNHEKFPRGIEKFPRGVHGNIWRVEVDYDRGTEMSRRFFGESGAATDERGETL
ncbi:MAG: toxin-antitoxin system YwqK family antitoxin [Polyangiales bacterium]